MKRFTLFFAMIAFCTVMFGQSLLEKRADFFVDAAAKEFSLTKVQKTELLTARMEYLNNLSDLFKQVKAGEITKEEQQEKAKAPNQKMRDVLEKMTGKTNKDLVPFYQKMSEELPKVK